MELATHAIFLGLFVGTGFFFGFLLAFLLIKSGKKRL